MRYRAQKMVAGKRYDCRSSISQEDADAKLAAKLESIHEVPKFSEGTFADFYYRVYVPHVYPDARPKTRAAYDVLFVHHILPALGHLPVSQIGLDDLHRLRTNVKRVDRSKDGKEDRKPLSAAHTREIVLRTKEALKLAKRLHLTQRDDWELAKAPKKPRKKERQEVEPDYTQRVMETVKGTYMELPVWLSLVLGMRRGEICGLRWSDIDHKAMTVTIRHQRQPKSGLEPPKRGRVRTLDVPSEVIAALDRLGDHDSAFLCTYKGRPVRPDGISKAIGWVWRRSGVRKVTLHDQRSICTSNLFALGADPVAVQEILGHLNLRTTEIYANAKSKAKRDAIRRALGVE